ncbi:MAG TPA: hypothetical protein VFI25_07630 [Planctomycetota bacterium]|jgi:hypothetical protein|nr:hypothetical protein [Planctomycetota bacterium]
MRGRTLVLAPIALGIGAPALLAAIERLDLRLMVEKADGAVVGRIESVTSTFHELPDAGEHVFTHVRVVGNDFFTGAPADVTVSFIGGRHGDFEKYCAEQPSSAELRLGNRVLAFYKWTPGMGGGEGMNGLYASHGGIFTVLPGPKGDVVLGKGDGYAVAANTAFLTLQAQANAIRASLPAKQHK